MKRLLWMGLAVTVLAGVTASCADSQVSITNTDSLVSNCQKVGDVSVSANTPNDEVNDEIANQARSKGANWVLLGSPGGRTGAAYRCAGPSVASR